MLVSSAYAQAATGAATGGGFDNVVQFLPLVLIFVVFYFLLIRPQQKKMKDQKALLDGIRRGDRIVTGGGIIGTVVKVGAATDEELLVEIAENVRVRVVRGTVSTVLAKPQPAADKPAATPAGQPADAAAPTAQPPGLLGGLTRLIGRK